MAAPKQKITIQHILLFMVLILMPAGSWYYLQAGLNYQKRLRAELGKYGQLPALDLIKIEDQAKTEEEKLRKPKPQLTVFTFVKEGEEGKKRLELLNSLKDQFEDTRAFTMVIGNLDGKESADLQQTIFKTCEVCKYFKASDVPKVLQETFKYPMIAEGRDSTRRYALKEIDTGADYPFIVFVDSENEIRNYYDTRDEAQMKRLVEHLAILLPRDEAETAIIVRETEK